MRWLALSSCLLFLVACPDDGVFTDAGLVDSKAGKDGPKADLLLTDGGVIPGDKGRLLLIGTVVTPDRVFVGEVLTNGDRIVCAAASCRLEADAKGATVIDTAGIIFPGLIDAHNHTQYNYLPIWKNSKLYGNHGQWQASADYKAAVSGPHGDLKAPDGTDGKGACTQPSDCTTGICTNNKCGNLLCEMIKYGEIRSLVAGTTSIQGTTLRKCADTLIRNLDLPYHGLGTDTMRTNVLGVGSIKSTTSLKADIASGKINAYVIHVAEGVDETARREFDKLESLGLLLPQTKIVHGTALGQAELSKVKASGMSIIWSPSSNMALYGKTNDISMVWSMKIPLALAPDWTPSGEANVIDELHFTSELNKTKLGELFAPKDLVKMVTSSAATVMGFGDQIGSIEKGKHADLLVIAGDRDQPYQALINARLSAVKMVLVAGKALYGDAALISKIVPNAYCETVPICNASKLLCVKESDKPKDKLNQTLADIQNALNQAYKPGILPLSTCR